MPRTDVVFYQEDQEDRATGRVWHELRRPLADILRDGIYELRIRKGKVNFRILYFFHGKNVAILGHALTKEDRVPKGDIERAVRRKKAYQADPATHTHFEEDQR